MTKLSVNIKQCRSYELPDTFDYCPAYPFKMGFITKTIKRGTLPDFDVVRPITDKQRDDIENILGCEITIESLRAWFLSIYNITQLDMYTWKCILHFFEGYKYDPVLDVPGVSHFIFSRTFAGTGSCSKTAFIFPSVSSSGLNKLTNSFVTSINFALGFL